MQADSESVSPTTGDPGSHPSPAASLTFKDLGLSEAILGNLERVGFQSPTPIQALFIPIGLSGRDVLGQAQTGTGKTAAFLLPIFQRLVPGMASPAALVLAPTRELALQIENETRRLGAGLGFSAITIYGGSSYQPQIKALQDGVDLVVGTPGRIIDHMRAGRLDLSGIRIAVLDEADRMLDLGFRKDIEYILRHASQERQTFLLSATIPDEIKRLAQRYMHDPKEIWTTPEKMTVEQVDQFYLATPQENKFPALLKLLDEERPGLAIIFCRTKREAQRLAERLKRLHINAHEIHGDLVQAKRERIMRSFRGGKVHILVATDIASRGIDVDNITHIINYDIPFRAEDYVHRIGRTGRMNKGGRAFTLVTRDDALFLTEIEQLINRQIEPVSFSDLKSHFWPVAPTAPIPDFAGEMTAGGDLEAEEQDQPGRPDGTPRQRQERGREPRRGGPRRRGGASHGPSHRARPAAATSASATPAAPATPLPAAPEAGLDHPARHAPAAEASAQGGKKRRRRRRRRGPKPSAPEGGAAAPGPDAG